MVITTATVITIVVWFGGNGERVLWGEGELGVSMGRWTNHPVLGRLHDSLCTCVFVQHLPLGTESSQKWKF